MGKQFHKAKKSGTGKHTKNKNFKTKHKTKDLDEIQNTFKPEICEKIVNQEIDLDLPGSGQFYCIHCAKHFMSDGDLQCHYRGKPHKRRLKQLRVEAYTQEESERAAGMGSYVAPKRVHVPKREDFVTHTEMDSVDSNTS